MATFTVTLTEREVQRLFAEATVAAAAVKVFVPVAQKRAHKAADRILARLMDPSFVPTKAKKK